MTTRDECLELDRLDPLAAHRDAFELPPYTIYMDGNSLGALPRATPARLREVIEKEWGDGLIRSWESAGWMELPRRVGAKIAQLIGARAEEVVCGDSTSVNLFKVVTAALRMQCGAGGGSGEAPRPRVVLSEKENFPTDLYIARAAVELMGSGLTLKLVESAELEDALDDDAVLLMLTHVNFRTGAMHDLAGLTRRAHEVGALTIWDLSHSAGAVPVDLGAAQADFAVGCGYKYLNGGPGAPAFVYAASRHLSAITNDPFAQPLPGWLGHREPFAFAADYSPADDIGRFTVGTPAILSLAALEVGVDAVIAAGIGALREKSIALTELFIRLVAEQCDEHRLSLVTPADPEKRGSQLCYRHPRAAEVMAALVSRGVTGDFRPPDVLRFGVAPLYLRYVDVYDAVEALREEG